MSVTATVFPKTTALLLQFHIIKNVRAKCIRDRRAKSNDVKVDGKVKKLKM